MDRVVVRDAYGLICPRRHAPRLARVLLACAVLAAVKPAFAQDAGDTNCDGLVNAADLVAAVDAAFEGSTCAAADVNADRVISVADLPEEVALLVRAAAPTATVPPATATPSVTPSLTFSPTSSPTPSPTDSPTPVRTGTTTVPPTATETLTPTVTSTSTVTFTPTVTATPTNTPTLAVCPESPGEVQLAVDNQTGHAISATVSGRRVDASCINARGLDETYTMDVGAGSVSVGHLAPGRWVHTLNVPSTGQVQHRASLVLAGGGSAAVGFTAVASVATVSTTNDAGPGSLRAAMTAANAATPPARIQFDDGEFAPGVPTVIVLVSALPVMSGSAITLDGIDANGAAGNRIVDVAGRGFAGLVITGATNAVIGMRVRNVGGNNRDVLSISGPNARGNLIERCFIEGSATADGIGIDTGAGTDYFAGTNTVRDSEIADSADKGIKVTTNAYARLERNWVHDNANGGIQSTLSGHVFARDNLVERNRGSTAQNGLSANGPSPSTPAIACELLTDGNVSRFNGSDGISVRGVSLAVINNDALLANGSNGLRVFDENGAAAAAVLGITAACNQVDGAAVSGLSQADFGGGPFQSPGSNAFTQNNLPAGATNLRNATGMQVHAENAQWEHCGRETECSIAAIEAYDVSDHGLHTSVAPAQAQRSQQPPLVTAVRPPVGVGGELVRIFGSGFNVIDAYAADATCSDVASRNRCTPLRGNCVRINNVPARIEAVTPTMLVVRLPFTCVEPQALTVQTQGGGTSAPVVVCTNAGE